MLHNEVVIGWAHNGIQVTEMRAAANSPQSKYYKTSANSNARVANTNIHAINGKQKPENPT